MKLEFKSIDEARAERRRIVPEIQKLQNWVSGIGCQAVNSFDYRRQRAEVVHKLTALQQRAGAIRDWIRDREGGEDVHQIHPNKVLLAKLHRYLSLSGDTSEEVSALLQEIEEQVPLAALQRFA